MFLDNANVNWTEISVSNDCAGVSCEDVIKQNKLLKTEIVMLKERLNIVEQRNEALQDSLVETKKGRKEVSFIENVCF